VRYEVRRLVDYFLPGEVVMLRGIDQKDQVDFLCPNRVVEDSAERTVLYTAVGSPLKGRWNLMDRVLDPTMPINLSPKEWRDTDFISVSYPGEMYSIWAMWKMPERRFQCWYINIESPMKRTKNGFDTEDLTLDVVVRPDLSWYWKDEDDFEKLVNLGYYSEELAADIRQAGLDAISRLESGSEPFSEPWPDWFPDASWGVPEYPVSLEEV